MQVKVQIKRLTVCSVWEFSQCKERCFRFPAPLHPLGEGCTKPWESFWFSSLFSTPTARRQASRHRAESSQPVVAFRTAAGALNLNGNLWRIATNGVIGCHNNKSSLPLNNVRIEKDAERKRESWRYGRGQMNTMLQHEVSPSRNQKLSEWLIYVQCGNKTHVGQFDSGPNGVHEFCQGFGLRPTAVPSQANGQNVGQAKKNSFGCVGSSARSLQEK